VLVGLMSNYYEHQRLLNDPQGPAKLGADPRAHAAAFLPRNGFRFSRGGGRHFDTQTGTYATNVLVEGANPISRDELFRRVGDGLYIGRIWYTYPINGMRAGDFTCTVVGDSYLIKDGRLAAPLKANAIRLDDSIHRLFNAVIGITDAKRPTLVWAADEIVHAPEIAVSGVPVREIGSFLAGGG
jgi:PmbA protein